MTPHRDALEAAGILGVGLGGPFLVGGAVRGILPGAEPSGYDIAPSLRPREVPGTLRQDRGRPGRA